VARKRIDDLVSRSVAGFISVGLYNETRNLHSLERVVRIPGN
jgi:hypothetical protein